MLKIYRNNYKSINKTFIEKKLIFPLYNRGFFSEVNNLALVVLYCLENEINLKLYSKKWVSGNWKDYFNPMIEEYNGFVPIPLDFYVENRFDKYYKKYHRSFKNRIIIQDTIWHEMRKENFTDKHFHYPNLGIDGGIFEAKRQILKLLLDFNTKTFSEIHELDIELVNLVKDSCGLHIRRGDKVSGKSKEAESFNVDVYVEKALQIDPNLTTFTLCTDDYEVIKDFKLKYPEFKLISLCLPYKNGYSQKEYNSKRKKLDKRNEVIDVLKDCNLLINSKIFIGAYSSNVARFVTLMKNNKQCYSIDIEWNPF